MFPFTTFDYLVAAGTITVLVAIWLAYYNRKPTFFKNGITDEAIENWIEHLEEEGKIPRKKIIYIGGYQPQNNVTSLPPSGGSGVPDKPSQK